MADARTIVIDPVTRIEGHLKIEVVVEEGAVKEARSSGVMFRGIEMLLRGKDPRDAAQVCQRICGVCPAIHGVASIQNLDMAFGVNKKIPDNGRLIRNLILGSNYLQSHILHFYHLAALDYIDIMGVAGYSGSDPGLNAVKSKIVGLVQARDTYPLTPRYDPDEFSVNEPTLATMLVGHYLQALQMRKKSQEMLAIFGGRMPMYVSLAPGGVTVRPGIDAIEKFRNHLLDLQDFVTNVYLADLILLGTGPLLAAHNLRLGAGRGNFLSYGVFDEEAGGFGAKRFLPAGYILDAKLDDVKQVDPQKIAEDVKYSWYKSGSGLPPAKGETDPDVNKQGAYSFIKAPRLDGQPMEVGPLARMLVMKDPGFMAVATQIGPWPSIVTRHFARAYEAKLVVDKMFDWIDQLLKNPKGDICEDVPVPKEGEGFGMVCGPRGALGHWITIKDHKIENYQAVVPTTWNCSPKDDRDVLGPCEQSLLGVPVPNPDSPINVVRVVRSYDPCLACAIHLVDVDKGKVKEFRVI